MIKCYCQKQLIGEEFILVYVSRGLNVHIGRGEDTAGMGGGDECTFV